MAEIKLVKTNGSLELKTPSTVIKNVEEIYVGNTAPTDGDYKVWVNSDKAVTEVATKEYVDQELENLDFSDIEIDLTDYYTKEEVDKAISNIEQIPGPPGEPGKDGEPGKPGKDGYSPVKGRDYWTIEDKAAIVNEVLGAMPAAEGVSV